MGVPAITSGDMRNAKNYFGNLALTNQYQLYITDGWEKGTATDYSIHQHLKKYDINFNAEFGQTLGLLCSEANLPTSSYATSEVKDNYIGVSQEFAHTRLYTDIDLTFYIDRDYKVLRFFEGWMDYISGGGEEPQTTSPNYFRRFTYPEFYKNKSGIYIKKFEKDYSRSSISINYRLINAFPKTLTSIPVSYGAADLLKVSVTFNYDRYIAGKEVDPPQPTAPQVPGTPPSPQGQQPPQPETADERQARLRRERSLTILSGQSVFDRDPSPRARSQNR